MNTLNEEYKSAIHDILRLSRDIRLYYDRSLEKYNIGIAHTFLLEYIAANPGTYANCLTDRFRAEKSTVSKSLRRLAEEGYIKAVEDEDDRRARKLYPTPSAEEVLRGINETQERLEGSIASALGNTELDTLRILLARTEASVLSLEGEEDEQQ